MIWLSRNTNVLDCLSPQKWKVSACSIYQVTHCSGSLTFSLFSATSMNGIPTMQGKRIMDSTQLHTSISAHVNCRTCTYSFPKQTVWGKLHERSCIRAVAWGKLDEGNWMKLHKESWRRKLHEESCMREESCIREGSCMREVT